ncbi:MAG: hypothetical protein PHS43_05390 [Firmicutes bacterium]|nr:hypothetical protein [Bacillota bacterium]
MKKLVVCFFVLAALLIPAMVLADSADASGWPVYPPPRCEEEVQTWYRHGKDWYRSGEGPNDAQLARCFRRGKLTGGSCNKEEWECAFTTWASMAQWCEWSISNTRWEWYILKPGTYAADCIGVFLKSNGDVEISFKDFGHLKGVNENTDEYIEVSYVARTWDGNDNNPPRIIHIDDTHWIPAPELNEKIFPVGDSMGLHEGLWFKLFNKIEVSNCNSAGEYEDEGIVYITLKNQRDWVDDDGTWGDLLPPLPGA